MIDILIKLADRLDSQGLEQESDVLDLVIKKMSARNKKNKKDNATYIFKSSNTNVLDKNNHFPINNLEQVESVISRVRRYSNTPDWYRGTLEDFKQFVVTAIKKKYKNIENIEEVLIQKKRG